MVTELKTYSLNFKQLNVVIQRFCLIDDELEVDAMLNFYHDLGVIVRHRSTVVLQAQWLIDLFRQLITIRSYKGMVRNLNVRWLHQLQLYWSEEVCSVACTTPAYTGPSCPLLTCIGLTTIDGVRQCNLSWTGLTCNCLT